MGMGPCHLEAADSDVRLADNTSWLALVAILASAGGCDVRSWYRSCCSNPVGWLLPYSAPQGNLINEKEKEKVCKLEVVQYELRVTKICQAYAGISHPLPGNCCRDAIAPALPAKRRIVSKSVLSFRGCSLVPNGELGMWLASAK
jgi:hypothetical protein